MTVDGHLKYGKQKQIKKWILKLMFRVLVLSQNKLFALLRGEVSAFLRTFFLNLKFSLRRPMFRIYSAD